MHPFLNKISFVIAIFIGSGLLACQQKADNSVSANTQTQVIEKLPKLLDRPEKLWYGNEWATVQNAYGKARQALLQDPDAKEPRLDLAAIFIQEARVTGEHPHYYPAALQVLNEVLEMDFDKNDIHDTDLKFRALSAKAGVQLSLHDFASALETGRQALAMNPHNAAIYGVLVDANVELGDYEEAVKMADKMVSIRPDLRSYSRVSYLRQIHGDMPGAIEAMEMAVTAGYPGTDQTSWASLTLGDLYLRQGDVEKAENQYRSILDVREDYPFALAALGELELARKNFEKAEVLFTQAAAIIPEVGFYEGLAQVYQATGRQAEFETTFGEIIEMMQDDEAHGHNMSLEFAHAYADLKNDFETAIRFAKQEYEKRPENIDVNGLLAEFYFKTGQRHLADQHLQKALRTGSKNSDWLALRQEISQNKT